MVADGEAQEAVGANPTPAVSSTSPVVESSALDRKAALAALVAKKREAVRTGQEKKRIHEDATTESWSGLRIEDRCVRREKWDAGMRGKQLVPFYDLSCLRPQARNQVVIGVLCTQPAAPRQGGNNERLAEWRLTDLDKTEAHVATLVLVDRAMDHWANVEGAGRSAATVGSIFGVLNPEPCPGRPGSMRVSFETQVLKLGTCPSLALCSAKRTDGLACRVPYNEDGGSGYCHRHATMSHGARQQSSPKRQRKGMPPSTAQRPLQRVPAPLRAGSGLTGAAPLAIATSAVLSDGNPEDTQARDEELSRAANVLTASTAAVSELLAAISKVEAALLTKPRPCLESRAVLKSRKLYEQVGVLASRPDAAGVAAKRLRRSWRAFLEDASNAPSL